MKDYKSASSAQPSQTKEGETSKPSSKTVKSAEPIVPDPLSGYQPPPNNPFANAEKLKSSHTSSDKVLAILLMSAIILIVGLGSWVGYQDFTNKDKGKIATAVSPTPTKVPIVTTTLNQVTPPPTSTPTPMPESTDIWAYFSDQDNGYSFKYPNDYTLAAYQEGSYNGISVSYMGPTQAASGRVQTEIFDGLALKTLVINDYNGNTSNYAAQEREKELTSNPPPTVSPISQTTLNGNTAYQYTLESMGHAKVTYLELKNGILKVVAIYEGSDDLRQKYLNRIDSILSTFELNN